MSKKQSVSSSKKHQTTLTTFLVSTFKTNKNFEKPPSNTLNSLSRTPNNFPPQAPYHHHYNDRSFSIFKGYAVRHHQPNLVAQIGYTGRLLGKKIPSHTTQLVGRNLYADSEIRLAYTPNENNYLRSTATCIEYIPSSSMCITGSTNGTVRCFNASQWFIQQEPRQQPSLVLKSERGITNIISSVQDRNKLFVSTQNVVKLYDLSASTNTPLSKYQFESDVLDFQLIGSAIVVGMRNGHVKYLDTRTTAKDSDPSETQTVVAPSFTPLSNPSTGFGAIGGAKQNTGSKLGNSLAKKSSLGKRRVVVTPRKESVAAVARQNTKFLSINSMQASACNNLLFVGTETGHCNVLDMRYVNSLICNPVKSIYLPDVIRRFEKVNPGNKSTASLVEAQNGSNVPMPPQRGNAENDDLMVIENINELMDTRHSLTMQNRFKNHDSSKLGSKYHPVTSITMDPNDSNLLAFTTGNGYVGYLSSIEREQASLKKLYKYNNIIPNDYLGSITAGDVDRPRPCFLSDFSSGNNCFFCVPNQNKMYNKYVDNNYVTILDWSIRTQEEIFKEEVDLGAKTRTVTTNSGSLNGSMLVKPSKSDNPIPAFMQETVCVVQEPHTGMILCAGSNDTIVALNNI